MNAMQILLTKGLFLCFGGTFFFSFIIHHRVYNTRPLFLGLALGSQFVGGIGAGILGWGIMQLFMATWLPFPNSTGFLIPGLLMLGTIVIITTMYHNLFLLSMLCLFFFFDLGMLFACIGWTP